MRTANPTFSKCASAGRDNSFLQWANSAIDSVPLSGIVWEENGKIVGNVSLVAHNYKGRKITLIANVATHPDYRRRGIGRALTERAMLQARQKGAKELWLQVRDDNPTAIKIYKDLGFVERARRTTYQTYPNSFRTSTTNDITVKKMKPYFWLLQRDWLYRAHPDELSWYCCLAGVAVNVLQTGFLFLPQRLALDFSRLSPIRGWQRIASSAGMVQLGFGMVKVVVVFVTAGVVLYNQRAAIVGLMALAPPALAVQMSQILLWTTIKIGEALLVLAILDYAYQRWRHKHDLRMTPQELREELKNLEGDPQRRARQKQLQRDLAVGRVSADH